MSIINYHSKASTSNDIDFSNSTKYKHIDGKLAYQIVTHLGIFYFVGEVSEHMSVLSPVIG